MSELWDYISSSGKERLEIVVPEWGPEGKPFVGYATVATVADEVKVRNTVKNADSPDAWARLAYNKLVDENGERCFKGVGFADFQRNVSAEVSRRVGQFIYLGSVPTVEEAEGN